MGALTAVAADRPAAAGPTTVRETVSAMAWLTAWGVAEAAGTVARPLPGPRTPDPLFLRGLEDPHGGEQASFRNSQSSSILLDKGQQRVPVGLQRAPTPAASIEHADPGRGGLDVELAGAHARNDRRTEASDKPLKAAGTVRTAA